MTSGGALRVLFVESWTEAGGAELSLLGALGAVDRARLDPVVATLGFGRGDFPDQLRRAGIEVVELRAGSPYNPLAWARTVLKLRGRVRRGGFRMVVSNGYHPHFYARPAAALGGAASVLFCRDYPRGAGRPSRPERAAFALSAGHYLAASASMVEAVRARTGGAAVSLVPGGIDPERFRPAADLGTSLRSELGIPEGVLVIACAGRLQPWKGQHVFLEAAALVAREIPEARFLVVGDALFGQDLDYPRQLREQAGRLGIADRTVFTGQREDMPAIYAASDVVVHSSVEPEPFGRVIVEAMACGRPVVVARAGGAAELFEEGISGLGYAPGDPREMAGAVSRLCRDMELRGRLGRSARERAAQRHTLEVSARALVEALEACLAPPAGDPQGA